MSLDRNNVQGSFTALVTPFNQDASQVDFESLENLIEFQIKAGINGLVICGSTGEAATLSDEEYKAVIKSAKDFVKNRVPLIAGVGFSSTNRAIAASQLTRDIGVDGILLVTPPYNKPPQEGIVAHFAAVKRACGLPIVAYNVPGRTATNMLPATVQILAREGLIVGLKESCGNWDQVLDVLALVKDQISVMSGDDSFTHALVSSGGMGVVSVLSNIEPELCLQITNARKSGVSTEAAEAQMRALALMRAMFMETNPIPVKTAAALKGIIKHPTLRLPLMPAKAETVAKLKSLLAL